MRPAWSDLLATALVGTDRRGATTVDGAVDGAGSPADVLDRAGALTVYRRAGRASTTATTTAAPAPPESLPLVPDPAARRLSALLDRDVPEVDRLTQVLLLEEWLTLAAARGRRVPPRLLPALLDHGRMLPALHQRVAAVGGARLRWLATQNPAWDYLVPQQSTSDDADEWAAGSAEQRRDYLIRHRLADPDGARERLAAEWSTLPPDERTTLLPTLLNGLGPADEPFLERALDDRRKDVRECAVFLLLRLPRSAYGDRMAERARAALRFDDDGHLTVEPPSACDPAIRRDGIAAKPPAGTGERAWWLQEVIARTPLSTWPSVVALVDAAGEWAGTIHSGLVQAVVEQGNRSVAAELVERAGPPATELLSLLDPAELARRATAALAQDPPAAWGPLLSRCLGPWPDELADAVLVAVERLGRQPKLTGDLATLIRLAAVRLPPAAAASAVAVAGRLESTVDSSTVAAVLAPLTRILTFRHEMTMELG